MTQRTDFDQFIADHQSLVNHFLSEKIVRSTNDDRLSEAMAYSVDAGGKRLRPLLTLATLNILGTAITPARLQAACALELLHTYSLIHDDLPAMDNDNLRRGKPTNHVKYGTGLAILAGDGLLTLTFEWLATAQLPINQRLALITALSHAAGPAGMVAGQATDVLNTQHHLDFEALQTLHRGKTGALIRYAMIAGGIMSEASQATMELLAKFGEAYGLAFQIYDDLMDVIGDERQMGKKVGKDAREQKNTYPGLFGVDGTVQRLSATIDEARTAISGLQETAQVNVALLTAFLDYFKIKE